MSEPFIGQINLFAGNFAPRGYSTCDGQLLSISQNTALFSLLGTIYGGDGRTTFALPNLGSRIPMHYGTGPGLSTRRAGQYSGADTASLTEAENANHNHTMHAGAAASTNTPSGSVGIGGNIPLYASTSAPNLVLNPVATTMAGSGTPHENRQPTLTLNFIIALVGIYPSRN